MKDSSNSKKSSRGVKKEADKALKTSYSPAEIVSREERMRRKNRIKNRPIIIMTYIMTFLFLCIFGYLIYFIYHDSDKVIANSSNKRQDSYSDTIRRGSIITSDGVVIAETVTDDAGNEIRRYPYGSLFCHSVGYNSYGRSGIELQMNFSLLRSHVNIAQKISNDLSGKKNPGDNVITTLDYKLQSAARDAMGGASGAVIVMRPSTGEILAMYSAPGFDPNDIDIVWKSVHSDEGSESTVLLNRATQGLYAPGSSFKVLTALEYIEENPACYRNYTYNCESKGIYDSVSIHCANGSRHGEVDLEKSLAYSCNTSFANIGSQIDMSRFRILTDNFLYNSQLPYDGVSSRSKFVLDGSSEKSAVPQTAIGQGDTLITPLHNALIYSAIANDGVMMKPYLIASVETENGRVIKKYSSESVKTVIPKSEADQMTEYLKAVCDYGTASGYFAGQTYDVAGKTGTAEYDNEGHCNSWFVGFSDPDDPDILVSAVCEDSDRTGITGVSVAQRIFNAYYY